MRAADTGMPALADDSGIEVDALNGAPGVYSARFSGPDADDAANNALLVEKLRNLPAAERSARYRAVIVLMRHAADPSPLICEGAWEGRIQLEPAGDGWFRLRSLLLFTRAGLHQCTIKRLRQKPAQPPR